MTYISINIATPNPPLTFTRHRHMSIGMSQIYMHNPTRAGARLAEFLNKRGVQGRLIPPPHYGKNTTFTGATRRHSKVSSRHPGRGSMTCGVGIVGWLRARVGELKNTPVAPYDFGCILTQILISIVAWGYYCNFSTHIF